MVMLVNHGGACCGARHIYNFRGTENEDIRDLENILQNQEETSWLMEVILSERQCRDKPAVIRRLNELGFVLTDRWTGNHGTPVNRFSRARQRLPLLGASTTYRWQGMVAGPGLSGNMGPGTFGTAANRNVPVGTLVRITYPQSRDYNQVVTITGTYRDYDRGTLYTYRRENGDLARVARSSFELVAAPAAPPAPAAPLRHPNVDFEPAAPAPVPAPAPRVVVTLFRNVFADGREGAFYETIEACVASAPRCRRKQRVVIMSDGTRTVTGGEGANPFPNNR